jgi:hypothetical protein
MGRKAIRARKRKPSLAHVDWDPGIIEDLDDQAEWSSYGSGIPRLGNPRRQRIWWTRWFRMARRAKLSRGRLPSPSWWTAIEVGALAMLVLVPALLFIVWLLHAL